MYGIQEDLRSTSECQHRDAVMEAVVKARNGSVLGKGSILKMYFFPGQRTSSDIQIHGAPHVYKVHFSFPKVKISINELIYKNHCFGFCVLYINILQ